VGPRRPPRQARDQPLHPIYARARMPRHHDAALPAPGVAPRRLQVFTPPTYPVHTSLVSSPQRWQVRHREKGRRKERGTCAGSVRSAIHPGSALDSREGSRSYLIRSRSGFWRVPQHYPGDGLGPSPGTGAGDIYPPGVFSCLGQQTTRIKGYRPPPFGCLISCTSRRISWSGVRLVRASPGDAVLSGPMNRASSVVGR